jgi:ABC-2 type transport system permease protein
VALVMFASGYLISAVAEEKENRTMEVLVTSVSPDQLVAGKVVGILAVMLVQLIAWVVTGVLAVWIGGGWLNIEALQNVTVDLRLVGLMALVAVPTLVMISALMTAVGATVTEVQEGQQVTGLFIIPIVLPLWLLQVILERPDSPLAVALTLIPPCSVITTSVRLGFTSVPGWQIAVGSAIATVGALVSLWLAARAFRLGMLQYGKALNWRHLLAPAAAGPGRRSV